MPGVPYRIGEGEFLWSEAEAIAARRAAYHAGISIALAMIVGGLLKLPRLIQSQPLTS